MSGATATGTAAGSDDRRMRITAGQPGGLSAIGNTPVVRLAHLADEGCAEVWVKMEAANPTGSYKDRMALAMIEAAEADGRLRPGQLVVEYTGGSTGSSLAFVCAVKGYPLRNRPPPAPAAPRRPRRGRGHSRSPGVRDGPPGRTHRGHILRALDRCQPGRRCRHRPPSRPGAPRSHRPGRQRPEIPQRPALLLTARCHRGWWGLGGFGEPGVQPVPDFFRGIGAAAALIAGDHHPGRGHTRERRQSQHFPPAHLLRLGDARREHHLG